MWTIKLVFQIANTVQFMSTPSVDDRRKSLLYDRRRLEKKKLNLFVIFFYKIKTKIGTIVDEY